MSRGIRFIKGRKAGYPSRAYAPKGSSIRSGEARRLRIQRANKRAGRMANGRYR